MWSPVSRRTLLKGSAVSPVPDRGAGAERGAEDGAGAADGRAAGAVGAAPPVRAWATPFLMAPSTSERVMRPPAPVGTMVETSTPYSLTSERTTGDISTPAPAEAGAGAAGAAGAAVGAGAGADA